MEFHRPNFVVWKIIAREKFLDPAQPEAIKRFLINKRLRLRLGPSIIDCASAVFHFAGQDAHFSGPVAPMCFESFKALEGHDFRAFAAVSGDA
jgi:hypothetical protein